MFDLYPCVVSLVDIVYGGACWVELEVVQCMQAVGTIGVLCVG